MIPVVAVLGAMLGAPQASADNHRLNNGVVANVYTVQHNAGCVNDVKIDPGLQLAAQWHTDDVLNDRALDGDIGSDGLTTRTGRMRPATTARSPKPSRSIPRFYQRHRDPQPVVLQPDIPCDHAQLRQLSDRRVVGQQYRPFCSRCRLRTAWIDNR